MARITTKWPRLLVTGKPVTPEQADEILLRTNGPYFDSNDDAWIKAIGQVLGIPSDHFRSLSLDASAAWYESIGGLGLHYLHNSRVVSPWIGGPHGWCDWDGRIGCGNSNIGKWPEVAEVEEDLAAIAAAFPYLDMRVQLVEEEGEGSLCGEWRVWDGRMMETEPGNLLDEPGLNVEGAVLALVLGGHRERGVTLDRLAAAYARVKPS